MTKITIDKDLIEQAISALLREALGVDNSALRQKLREALAEPAVRCSENMEKRVAWVAYTNHDLTEGRGHDIPIAVCEIQATATRLARKRYVQGSDGPVRAIEIIKIGREWYAPESAYILVPPTKEDDAYQTALDARNDAMSKARALGLTDSDLSALGVQR